MTTRRGILRSLNRNERGTIGISFAFMAPVLLAMVGAAIDFGRAYKLRQRLQISLDAAVLFMASSVDGDRVAKAQTVFQENFKSGDVQRPNPIFIDNSDGTVTGLSDAALPASFLKVIGIKEIPIKTSATASSYFETITQATYTPISAKGWFPKDIFAFVRTQDGRVTQMVPVLSYDYDWVTRTGNTTLPLGIATQTFKLQNGATLGVMLRVWPQGRSASEFSDSYSDDPSASVIRQGDCQSSEVDSWEDGGDIDYKDLVYGIKCETVRQKSSTSRLVQ